MTTTARPPLTPPTASLTTPKGFSKQTEELTYKDTLELGAARHNALALLSNKFTEEDWQRAYRGVGKPVNLGV